MKFKEFLLTEILDKPAKLEVYRDTDRTYRAKADINDRHLDFRLDRWPDQGKWNFTFVEVDKTGDEDSDLWDEEGETYDATGRGNEFVIFATAKAFIEDAIKVKSPNVIYFEADKMKGPNRAKLYNRFVQRWQPPGYKHRKVHTDKNTDYHAFVEKKFYAQTYKDKE
jgi:hypothetical protein